jgi:hypothetical protein
VRSVDTPLWIALLGLVATAWGAVRIWRTKTFLDRAHKSPGRYVSTESRGWGEETATHMVVEFETADGRSIIFVTRTAAFFFPGRRVGEPVEVFYDPENPQKALVNRWPDTWGFGLLLAAAGIYMLLAVLGVVPLGVG